MANAMKFHKQLKAFLKDLIAVFPNDRDIKVISSSLNIAMLDDEDNVIIKGFYETLEPFEKLIETRDNSLFTRNVSEITSKLAIDSTQYQLFDKLHIYWESLSEHNRNTVWDYFQVLYRMASEFRV